MYSLLVLGIIPGTNIQITFIGWLTMAAVLLTVALLVKTIFTRQTGTVVAKANDVIVRTTLHAKQLHARSV